MSLVVAKTPLRRRLQHELLRMIMLVVALDSVAIFAFLITGMKARTGTPRIVFTTLWTVLTLAVVLSSLHRIRALRIQARRGALR